MDYGSSHFRQSSRSSDARKRPIGLRRAFSPLDGFCYAVYADSIVTGAALTFAVAAAFPRANLPLAIVFICVGLTPVFAVYALLTSLLPRSGGDYVWQSLVLGKRWAFVLVFGPLVIGPWFYMASNVAPGATSAAAPLFYAAGELIHAHWLFDVARWVTTRDGQFTFYLVYLLFGAALVGAGMRVYARFQRWSFLIGCVGLLSFVLLILSTTHAGFVSSYDHWMRTQVGWGHGHAYRAVLGAAPATRGGTSLQQTILVTPVLAYVFLFVAWTGSVAGEISGVAGNAKRSLSVYLGANFFAMAVSVLFWGLLIEMVSRYFFVAANHVALLSQAHIGPPVAPLAGTFLMAVAGSPLIRVWIGLVFLAWFLAWPVNNYVASTRFMFAMALDGRLPPQLLRVVGRTGTPITTLAVSAIGMTVCGYLYWYTSLAKLTLALPLFSTVAYAGTCLAGALVPFRASTRQLYASSSLAALRVRRVPAITVLGALGLVPLVLLIVAYVLDSRYGLNGEAGLWFASALAAAALGVTMIQAAYSRRARRSSAPRPLGRVDARIERLGLARPAGPGSQHTPVESDEVIGPRLTR